MTTAVVTMVYNEPHFLPLWLKYYGGQFGLSHCYVVDHGSDDGTTSDLAEVNIVGLPRSPMHDQKRAKFLSGFCSSLLQFYDTVIYTDVDEFLVADPARWDSLRTFCETTTNPVTTAVGFNITHIPDQEPELDPSKPILSQRTWANFVLAMCKPLIIKVAIEWTPGFHASNRDVIFDDVYMMHLHNYDLTRSLKRLAITRTMPWGDGGPDHHQRWSDERHIELARTLSRMNRLPSTNFDKDSAYIGRYLTWVHDLIRTHPERKELFYVNTGLDIYDLVEVPDRFRSIF